MVGTTDALYPGNVLELAQGAVRGDGNVEFSLKTPYEATALIGHACMLAVNFRLVGLGEEHTIGLFFASPFFLCFSQSVVLSFRLKSYTHC
jgi:hypothetical protein